MEVLLSISYICFFLFLIKRLRFFKTANLPFWLLGGIFILKLASGIFMTLIYTYYYTDRSTADIFRYFDDSQVLYQSFFANPLDGFRMLIGYHSEASDLKIYYDQMNSWYREFSLNNDNRSMIRLNTLFRFFSMNFFYVHVVFMAFLSMSGLTAIYKLFNAQIKDRRYELFCIVFVLPSVLFWGSGVLKDSLMLFALGFLLHYMYRLFFEEISMKSILCVCFFSFLLIMARAYIMAAIFPGMLAWLWIAKTEKRPWIKFFTVHGIYLFIVFNIHYVMPHGYYNALKLLAARQRNFMELAEASHAGSLLPIHPLLPSYSSLLHNLPEAFWNVLMRPYFFESLSPLILLAGIENLLIFVCMVFCLFTIKRSRPVQPLFFLALGFVLICFSLTGLVTPVAGAIVRYKMPALPFLFLIFLLISDKNKQSKYLNAFLNLFKVSKNHTIV